MTKSLLLCGISNIPLATIESPFPLAFPQFVHPIFTSENLFSSCKELIRETQSGDRELFRRLYFLGTFYHLSKPKLSIAGLPSLELVEEFTPNLVKLADHKLRIPKLVFPEVHISKENNFDQLGDLILTFEDFLNPRLEELKEQEIKFQNILLDTRNFVSLGGDIPRAKLWKWIQSLLLSTPYRNDLWIGQIFLAKSDKELLIWDRDEIQLAIEVISSSLPLGTGLSPQVNKRLDQLSRFLNGYYLPISELELEEAETKEQLTERKKKREDTILLAKLQAPLVEPQQKDFKSLGDFLVAKARFQLART